MLIYSTNLIQRNKSGLADQGSFPIVEVFQMCFAKVRHGIELVAL